MSSLLRIVAGVTGLGGMVLFFASDNVSWQMVGASGVSLGYFTWLVSVIAQLLERVIEKTSKTNQLLESRVKPVQKREER